MLTAILPYHAAGWSIIGLRVRSRGSYFCTIGESAGFADVLRLDLESLHVYSSKMFMLSLKSPADGGFACKHQLGGYGTGRLLLALLI